MTAKARRRRCVLLPAFCALVVFAVLVGLGTWQVRRLAWKEGLTAAINARLSAPPGNLPPRAGWSDLTEGDVEYRRYAFGAELLPGQEALVFTTGSAFRPDVSGVGYWVFAPARLAGGSIVVINRGFVPDDKHDAATRPQSARAGMLDIVGVGRWPEARGEFTPKDNPDANRWYARDPAAMAAAYKWGEVAPFYIEQVGPVAAGVLPQTGRFVPELRNAHLQYAVTWYGLAAALVAVFIAWLIRRRRAPDAAPARIEP